MNDDVKDQPTPEEAPQSTSVDAPPEVVFPLLCPVREYEWLEDWTCEMVFSESGVAEEDCVSAASRSCPARA